MNAIGASGGIQPEVTLRPTGPKEGKLHINTSDGRSFKISVQIQNKNVGLIAKFRQIVSRFLGDSTFKTIGEKEYGVKNDEFKKKDFQKISKDLGLNVKWYESSMKVVLSKAIENHRALESKKWVKQVMEHQQEKI